MNGEKDWRAAEIEALEEAELEGTFPRKPIGEFEYAKTFNDGTGVLVKATVYPLYSDTVKRRRKETEKPDLSSTQCLFNGGLRIQ